MNLPGSHQLPDYIAVVEPRVSLQQRGGRLYQDATQTGCGINRFEKTHKQAWIMIHRD